MRILILGGGSDVAYALARQFANKEKADIYFASRDIELLKKRAEDIQIRYNVKSCALYFDALDIPSHKEFYENLRDKPDVVIAAFGYLGNQEKARQDFQEARQIIETNFMGAVSILEIIASDFEKRGHGLIVGISSAAGERGRCSNYIYGAAKGALSIYLSGLRNRLHKRGVRVISVIPGFIRSKMTEHLDLPVKITAVPEDVAKDVYRGYKGHSDIIYTRWYWRWIMFIIKIIPEKIFKRMSI